jgi:hypothetical protein
MVYYVRTLEEAEAVCRYLGSNCLVCHYDWCDIAVDGEYSIHVFNATERLVDVVTKRIELYKVFRQLIELISSMLNIDYDHEVLSAIVGNFHRYGYPKCICKNSVCPCDEVILVAENAKDTCSCGLLKRSNSKPMNPR